MRTLIYTTLLLSLVVTVIIEVSTAPAYDDIDGYGQYQIDAIDRYNDDYYLTYRNRPVRRSYGEIGDLKRGYYYIDNGFITPVSSSSSSSDTLAARRPRTEQRRQDNFASTIDTGNVPDGYKIRPVLRFRQAQTKHKKLFVPNLFG